MKKQPVDRIAQKTRPTEKRPAFQELNKALTCLYLEVDKSIVEDIENKAVLALEEARQEGREEAISEIGYAIIDVLANDYYTGGFKAVEIANKVEAKLNSNN